MFVKVLLSAHYNNYISSITPSTFTLHCIKKRLVPLHKLLAHIRLLHMYQ